MTNARVAMVDVYVIRGTGDALELLVLRRAPDGRCAGAWETVHGHLEAEEHAVAGARRELLEEAGLVPERLYNLSRLESFYLHRTDQVALIPVFTAVVAPAAEVRLSEEHDAFAWLPAKEAAARFAWPRERRAVEDILALLVQADAGPLEDVLRVE